MLRNSHTKSAARITSARIDKNRLRQLAGLISFGISGRQWLASIMICAMVWPLMIAPVGAFAAPAAGNSPTGFEPVNESLPLWTSEWRNLSSEIESWKTPLWNLNSWPASSSGDDDKDKKKNKDGKVGPATSSDKPGSDTATHDVTKSDAVTSTNAITSTTENSHSVPTVAAAPTATYFNELPADEHDSIYSYENNLGSPKGQTQPDSGNRAAAMAIRHRPGVADYSFSLPLASLPGRGIDAGIGLTYSSRTWNKSCAEYTGGVCTKDHFTYDVEESWIAPGFSSGFGYLESVAYDTGSNNLYTVSPLGMTDSDGTRHQFVCNKFTGSLCSEYRTNDGTFIKSSGQQWISGLTGYAAVGFTVTYPNGSKLYYAGPFGDGTSRKHYPVIIQDNNGNRIHVAYNADQSGRINYIRDTLNREIKFYYENDSNGDPDKLVAVTIPGIGTNDEIQTVRFYYDTLTLDTGGFEVGAEVTGPSASFKVLKYIYMPATKTGFKYEYNSTFGMINKISRFVGMTASSTSLTETGAISNDGLYAASTEYDFPSGSVHLTDVPKYTKRLDDWAGNSGAAQETDYGEETPGLGEAYVSTITVKDTGYDVIYRTSADSNGLLKETSATQKFPDFSPQVSKTKYTWSTDGKRNLKRVQVTNDADLTKATEFEYDAVYNNQIEVRECDYAAPNTACTETNAIRRTQTTYEDRSGWIENNLLSLPTAITTIVGGVNVSKTVLEYDHGGSDSTITWRNDIDPGTHDITYNPDHEATVETVCPDGLESGQSALPNGCVLIHHPGYSAASAYRGNVTKVTRFSDATLSSDTNADVSEYNHDIAGNLVSATLSCCNVKTIDYGSSWSTTGYAYPVSETKGSLPTQLTTSATYNLNTGLVLTSTNENGQTTSYEYETDTLRPKKTTYPNGGYVQTEYSDKLITETADLLPGFTRQTTTLDSTQTVQSYGYYDGRGLGIRSATETPDGWLISAMEYDTLGRARKSYNPFYGSTPTTAVPSGTAFSQVTSIDALGRTLGVTLQDGTTVSTHFSDAAIGDIPSGFNKTWVKVTDQAGKIRRQVMDSLGRIVRVDEPDANGSLGAVDASLPSQQTSYEYDGNDNLAKVTQSDGTTTQERKFKYDSLSRLVAEKQVEASPTLDLDGTHGTESSSKWTKVLKYDTHGLLTDGWDARGVHTQMSYDGLNRVSGVSYSGETGYQTPAVTYTYDQARGTGIYNTGALTTVETAASGDAPATKTEFDYDLMGRVSKHRQWIGSQEYDLEYGYNLAGQLTSEKYPSGKIVTMGYDANGRFASIADQSRTYLNGPVYQGKGGSISSMNFGNGTSETFILNDRLQMTDQTLSKGSDVLQKYDYGYGQIDTSSGTITTGSNNGQLAKIESYIGSSKQWEQRFGYDSIGRLSESREYKGSDNSLTYKQKFDFDRFGNMYRKAANNGASGQANPLPYTAIEETTTTGTGDIDKSSNRFRTLTPSDAAGSVIYDEAGNVVLDKKFRIMGFGYDANGRMVKATKTDVPDALSVYDAAGMRVAENVNDVWRFLVYDIGGKMVAEYGGLQSTDEGGVKYLLTDWQGSTRAVLSNTGAVQGRSDYTAYGEEISAAIGPRTAEQGFGAANSPRQKYGLTERDDATGMDHTRFRKHENRAGRWTGADPYGGSISVGDPQSFNRYAYVSGQPTNFVDPSGLFMAAPNSSGGYCVRYHYYNPSTGEGFWGPWTCSSNAGGGGGGGGGGGAGSGGGQRGGGRPSTAKIISAINACLNKLWGNNTFTLEVTAISAAVSGSSPGSIGMRYVDIEKELTGQQFPYRYFDVTTDASTYTGTELAQLYNDPSRPYLVGYTPSNGYQSNYLANDLRQHPRAGMATNLDVQIGIGLAAQIHELGVSLSETYGYRAPPPGYSDRDSGMALEDCVSGQLSAKK